MHHQYSSWIPLNRITNRDEEMESQKKKRKSQRHHNCSSSSSRTWRAKTVKESSEREGHSSVNTVQLIATILLFSFYSVLENRVEHSQRKTWSCTQLSLAKSPVSYIWVCHLRASCSCHLRPISLCLMKWMLLTLSAISGYWSTETT